MRPQKRWQETLFYLLAIGWSMFVLYTMAKGVQGIGAL